MLFIELALLTVRKRSIKDQYFVVYRQSWREFHGCREAVHWERSGVGDLENQGEY